jgi:CelD/BcsL family acetyltransferase involved in cellulose biosynthesis
MRRRLDAAGARIEIVASKEDLATALQAFSDVYSRSWKRPEPVPTFVPALAELAARRGWLRLGLVWLDHRPIAAQLWVVADGRASIYKLAYDKHYRHLGCGTVLTAELMRHAIEVDRVREIDYMAGDEPYKRDWMTHRRERCGLEAHQLGTLRGLGGAFRSFVGTVWRYPAVLTRGNHTTPVGEKDTSTHSL